MSVKPISVNRREPKHWADDDWISTSFQLPMAKVKQFHEMVVIWQGILHEWWCRWLSARLQSVQCVSSLALSQWYVQLKWAMFPVAATASATILLLYCPACRTSLIATKFWVVVICPIIKCLTVLEFSFILFDLCLFITIFNFILNYVPIITFWIFTYHKIWILLIMFRFIWNYWIIYSLTCLEVFWSVVS